MDEQPTDQVMAFIEIPQGSRNKYEYDPETGRFQLDRVLFHAIHYPADYGFVLDTLALDGDQLDILVLVQEPTFPGCIVPARPVGGLDMTDEKGKDFKVLAVPVVDPRFDHVRELSDLGEHWPKEIEAFFATYKLLEPKWSEVEGWRSAADAWRVIRDCQARWRDGRG